MKGHEAGDHVLACFGGAGPQHACAVARSLGMTQVVVHRFSGILSAYGMGMANVVKEAQEPCAEEWSEESMVGMGERARGLKRKVEGELERQVGGVYEEGKVARNGGREGWGAGRGEGFIEY